LRLCTLHPSEVSFDLLLTAFSIVGLSGDDTTRATTSLWRFLSEAPIASPSEALLYGSMGVVFAKVLDVLANENLVSMHPTALDTFVAILQVYRELPEPIERDLLSRLRALLLSDSPTTVDVVLHSLHVLVPVLRESFSPLVPSLVRIFCLRWNDTNRLLLLETVTVVLTLPPMRSRRTSASSRRSPSRGWRNTRRRRRCASSRFCLSPARTLRRRVPAAA
jgi:hypothetical protein